MDEYMVELDGIYDFEEKYYSTDDYSELVKWVENDLRELGGGHADIFDTLFGNFVGDVEV